MADCDALSSRADLRLNPVRSKLPSKEDLVNDVVFDLQQGDAHENAKVAIRFDWAGNPNRAIFAYQDVPALGLNVSREKRMLDLR